MTLSSGPTRSPDVVIVGAGLIGLALALELNDRGAHVAVIDRGHSFSGASTAAAGMLAAEDPGNPPELRPLSRLSAERYPAFLARIEALSGIAIPFQTSTTIQYLDHAPSLRLAEHSLDPRQLAHALRAAIHATPIRLLEHTSIAAIHPHPRGAAVHLAEGPTLAAATIVYAAGAWTPEAMRGLPSDALPIAPCKGQMLRVRLAFPLHEVHRSERIYICPRTSGPQQGSALIGATVENAAFDTSVHAADLDALRSLAAELLPELASLTSAPAIESWAGLRPASPDKLPILGPCSLPGHFVATGHYRNGILQAPGTALIMADLIENKSPLIDLSLLSPLRFAPAVP